MMLKTILSLSLICCIVSDETSPDSESSNKGENRISNIVRLPEAEETELLTIKSDGLGQVSTLKLEDCVDEAMYSPENLRLYKDDSDLLCGFYAFQANKKKGVGVSSYSDAEESSRRLEYFTETVKSVSETNARFDKGEITWTAGINFFADMSPEERYPYSHGLRIPGEDDEDSSSVGMGLGMGLGATLGASRGDGMIETPEEDIVGKIVRLPEEQETELLTSKTGGDALGQVTVLKIEDCVSEVMYSNEKLREYEDDSDLLCGFYAFQANKKKGVGVSSYSDAEESSRRLEYFTETVKSVSETNARFDKGEITWTAEVNFFADMSPEEMYPYSHGVRLPEDENFGMRLGAGAIPLPREEESDEEKMERIVRLSEEMEHDILKEANDMSSDYQPLELKDCIDEELYSNDNLKEYRDQRDVLCGFYAFQANKKLGVPRYADEEESGERMRIFARAVREVLRINTRFEKGEIAWTAAINHFADMTAEELMPRRKGIITSKMMVGGDKKMMVGGKKGILLGGGSPTPDDEKETVEEKINKIVRLTEADESDIINSDSDDEEASNFKTMTVEDCVDESVYSYENLKDIDSSDEYLCAFYAFQANKKQGQGVSSYGGAEEAKERLAHFTDCVQRVQIQNEKYEAGNITYTSAVNFFCDMSDEERYPYSHGIRGAEGLSMPDDESVEDKVKRIVRLTEADESDIMNSDSDDEEASNFKTLSVEDCVDESVYDYVNLKDIDSSDEFLCAFYAFQANKMAGVGLKAYAGASEAKERLGLFTKCVENVQETNEQYEKGEITYTAAVNFFCDMTDKEKYPYSHGIKSDVAEEMSVFGVPPADLKSEKEKMNKVVRMTKTDELEELGGALANQAVLSLENCVDSDIYHFINLDNVETKLDYMCAYYAFQANKESGEGLSKYRGAKESRKRFHLFSKCVDRVKEMNEKFRSGKQTYSGEVNFFCDMTDDERKMYTCGINKVIGKDDNNRLLVLMNKAPEEEFEDHPIGNGGL